jgi:hypothetical protein
MIFKGVGIVRRRGRIIANFTDGTFETGDPGVIDRLKMLGFKEVKVRIPKQKKEEKSHASADAE